MNMIKLSCPYCEAVHYQCVNCHEVFDSPQMMDQNLIAARETYDLLESSVTSK